MIAKRISSKAKTSRIARLVKYVVAAEGGIDPRSWARTADYMLCSGTSSRGEKVGGVRVTNCHTDDPAAATSLIEATQAANTRSKTDKTYHLVFSFPPGEEPDLKVLHAIEDQLCAAIGYADHQRISAVHIDTDHLHVHVAINKVHPTGFQNIEPYFDKKKLMETCERLELECGLQRTNHGLDGREPKSKVKPKQAQAEAHSGVETLTGHVAREVAPRLKEAKSWKEAHSILAKHGLEIKQRGAGLVIGSGDIWVKASQCDRGLSFKAMTDRLGPIEKGQKQKPAKAYEPKPRQSHPSSAVLFEQYRRERELHAKVRERGLEQIKYESAVLEANLQKWRVAQKLLAKVAAKGPKRRAMLKVIKLQTTISRRNNWSATEAKRRKLIVTTAMPSWSGWLEAQANGGNADALSVLRSREQLEQMRGNILTAKDSSASTSVIIPMMQPQAEKDGSISYSTADGGLVIDRKTHVQSFKTTAGASQLALEIASQRFKEQALIVEGSEQFKADVARLAGAYGVQVRFADPAMEQARKAAIISKTPVQKRGKEAEL